MAELLPHPVQKANDICDRVCGVAKARMRSLVSSRNDLLNANDIQEGMEYAGGVKNTKIAVAEIVPGMGKYYSICSNYALTFFFFTGCLGKTNVPNISKIRSIQYYSQHMQIFKASNNDVGVSIPYKNVDFKKNMRVVSSFTAPIIGQETTVTSKK